MSHSFGSIFDWDQSFGLYGLALSSVRASISRRNAVLVILRMGMVIVARKNQDMKKHLDNMISRPQAPDKLKQELRNRPSAILVLCES